MNQTKPYRDAKRRQYTAELVANARMLPDSYDGDWLDRLIEARNAMLLSPCVPSFASQMFERDGNNEWSATTVWRIRRNSSGLNAPEALRLDIDSDLGPRHWTVRRHATDLENRMARLPWFLRRQAV